MSFFLPKMKASPLYHLLRVFEHQPQMPLSNEVLRRIVHRGDAARELRRACASGELELATELAEIFGLTADDLYAHSCRALTLAAKRGHLAIVRWLVTRFGLTDGSSALRAACGYGHVEIARLILEQLGPPPDLEALRLACMGGRLAAARLVAEAWALDVHADRSAALAAAAGAGRRAVVDWLLSAGTPSEAGAMNALHGACIGGDLAIVQQIARAAKLSATHLQARELLHSACECGNLEIARWLAQFGWPARHAPAALTAACKGGHLAVAQWLVATYGPTADAALLQRACESGSLEVAQWLLATFGMTLGGAAAAEAAYCASGAGYLMTLKWMAETFAPLSRGDAGRARGAAISGHHRGVASWLTSHYHLRPAARSREPPVSPDSISD